MISRVCAFEVDFKIVSWLFIYLVKEDYCRDEKGGISSQARIPGGHETQCLHPSVREAILPLSWLRKTSFKWKNSQHTEDSPSLSWNLLCFIDELLKFLVSTILQDLWNT